MIRRIVAATTAAVATTLMLVASASAATTVPLPAKIGPNQAFVGTVNGSSGVSSPALIRVACPGPITAGETTHPLAHQPLEVSPAAAVNSNAGNTGPHGTQISAFYGIPPAAAGATGGLATFKRYGVKKPIPTTLVVPCSGSGYITFIPFPRDPGLARSFVVPVEFVNIAV